MYIDDTKRILKTELDSSQHPLLFVLISQSTTTRYSDDRVSYPLIQYHRRLFVHFKV